MRDTWDGLPVAEDKPHAAVVVVWRRREDGNREFLLLHRAHHGPDYAGDWAWGSPAGARLPAEAVENCARRELREETGLELSLRRTECGSDIVAVYEAEVPDDRAIELSAEHDAYRWLPLAAGQPLCLPALVGEQLAAVAAAVGDR